MLNDIICTFLLILIPYLKKRLLNFSAWRNYNFADASYAHVHSDFLLLIAHWHHYSNCDSGFFKIDTELELRALRKLQIVTLSNISFIHDIICATLHSCFIFSSLNKKSRFSTTWFLAGNAVSVSNHFLNHFLNYLSSKFQKLCIRDFTKMRCRNPGKRLQIFFCFCFSRI